MLTMLAVPLKLPTPDSGILDLENVAQVWRRGKWDFPVYGDADVKRMYTIQSNMLRLADYENNSTEKIVPAMFDPLR